VGLSGLILSNILSMRMLGLLLSGLAWLMTGKSFGGGVVQLDADPVRLPAALKLGRRTDALLKSLIDPRADHLLGHSISPWFSPVRHRFQEQNNAPSALRLRSVVFAGPLPRLYHRPAAHLPGLQAAQDARQLLPVLRSSTGAIRNATAPRMAPRLISPRPLRGGSESNLFVYRPGKPATSSIVS